MLGKTICRPWALLLAVAMVLSLFSGCEEKKKEGSITLLDNRGQVVAVLGSAADLQSDWSAYAQIALIETAELLAQQEGGTAEAVLESLFERQLTIHTALDKKVMSAITQSDSVRGNRQALGIAITDLQGSLLAAYSSESEVNLALEKNAPYSAFKPLSVYLPAIEEGKIDWFTRFEDSPYKQLQGENGTAEDWPQNADHTYSMEQKPVYTAIKNSLNTVAVKCLAQLGVSNSIAYLQDRFGIALKQEAKVAQELGEEEVLGNIALGYLESGVSVVDMAGYYQIFGTGGLYAQPRAVTKLTDAAGTVLYERELTARQVTSPEAADVMNRLLQEVVTDGTGTGARLRGVQVAGKTGTGDDYEGNWFVGLIPGYSCAVWHGKAERNMAAGIFGSVMEQVFAGDEEQKKEFKDTGMTRWEICCVESGLPVGKNCRIITEAYFISDYKGEPCNINHEN